MSTERVSGRSSSPTWPQRVRVETERAYDVVVGRGLDDLLPDLVGRRAARVAVFHPVALRSRAEALRARLARTGWDAHAIEVPDGEPAKTSEVAAFCWSVLARTGFTRTDTVVGLGGGATTDLAGFVASTWLRGVPVVHVPTTLLGMVDAALGGKTGINLPEGKNLVGAFHEPQGVLCDLATLDTLPERELRSGLAEVVKVGFVADPRIIDLVLDDPDAAVATEGDVLSELVLRAVRVKARVVADDLRETGSFSGRLGREVLNYGHTLGHAIEAVEGYRVRHGEAVSVGMVFAAELAASAGRLDADTVALHRDVLSTLGLPTGYRAGAWEELHRSMRLDKKARADRLRFVVLDGLGRPGILEAPGDDLLAAAYARITARRPVEP